MQHSWLRDWPPPVSVRLNPAFNGIPSLPHCLFIGVAMRLTPWKFRNGDNIGVVRLAPLNYHRVPFIRLDHFCTSLSSLIFFGMTDGRQDTLPTTQQNYTR